MRSRGRHYPGESDGVTDHDAHRFDPRRRNDPRASLAPTDVAMRLLLAHQAVQLGGGQF